MDWRTTVDSQNLKSISCMYVKTSWFAWFWWSFISSSSQIIHLGISKKKMSEKYYRKSKKEVLFLHKKLEYSLRSWQTRHIYRLLLCRGAANPAGRAMCNLSWQNVHENHDGVTAACTLWYRAGGAQIQPWELKPNRAAEKMLCVVCCLQNAENVWVQLLVPTLVQEVIDTRVMRSILQVFYPVWT